MLISKDRIGLILERFSIVFPAPCPPERMGELADIWHKVFSHIEESWFDRASLAVMHTVKRFPCPADFVEALDRIPPKPTSPLPDGTLSSDYRQ